MPHFGQTLLLTFNKTLVTYLKFLKSSSLGHVCIENYHVFARGYLNFRGKMQSNCICSNPEVRKAYIQQALDAIKKNYEPSTFFDRPIDFFCDEIEWISGNGIESEDEYVKVERVGRVGTNLSRTLRPVMYEIYREYLNVRQNNRMYYDWDDIAYYVRKEFESDNSPRRYKHIIVDEGQDFSPAMIRSLAAAIPDDGTLSFFGDVAQQIYGQRISWRSAGLTIPQVWHFQENYRNTGEISRLAIAISKMPFFNGIADLVEPTMIMADSELPTLVKCLNRNQQVEISIRTAREEEKTRRVAILVKNREQEKEIISKIGNNSNRLHRDLSQWNNAPGIFHGTYHSAKGLEFDTVILPFLDSANLPDQDYIECHNKEDALTYFGKLLYVAVTRAKTRLLLLFDNSITPLLPSDQSLYQGVEL